MINKIFASFVTLSIFTLPAFATTKKVPLPPERPFEFQEQSDVFLKDVVLKSICFKNLSLFMAQANDRGFLPAIASFNSPKHDGEMLSVLFNRKEKKMLILVTKKEGLSCIVQTGYDFYADLETMREIFADKPPPHSY